MSRKTTYKQSINKKAVQECVFNYFKKYNLKKLIGLGGPNITDYLKFIKSKGIKQAIIYEFNFEQLMLQMKDYTSVIPCQVIHSDINQAKANTSDVLYDLDFCCSAITAIPYIKKFKKNAVFTLSMRPLSKKITIDTFCKAVNPNNLKVVKEPLFKNTQFELFKITIGSEKYHCYEYHDTVPMYTIHSIN